MQWPPGPMPGPERLEPERLRRCGVDDLPDVDAHAVAELGELVDERDVDGAVGVLEQLRHLGGCGRRDLAHLGRPHERLEHERRTPSAFWREPADDLRRRRHGPLCVAGVDALGREGEVEVDTRPQPGGFERRRAHLGRRARIRRRLEDDEVAGTERRGDRGQRGPHIGQIRCLVAIRRRRHADEHDIGPVEHRPVCRCGEPPGRDLRGEARVCDVLDVAPARVQRIGAFGVGVEADDREPGLRVRDCERQPDVAEPHDADDERSGRDALHRTRASSIGVIHWRCSTTPTCDAGRLRAAPLAPTRARSVLW